MRIKRTKSFKRRYSFAMRLDENGFILPLSVILVIVLLTSGAGFLNLDYLERRTAMNESHNLDAFYLANTGIERARTVFKIPLEPAPSWTPILDDTDPHHPPQYPT